MSTNKKPSKMYRIAARIAVYMADGELHPVGHKILLRFARLFEEASREGNWLSNKELDALYQEAMVQTHCTKSPFKRHRRYSAVRILYKSGLVERGEGQSRWHEQEEGAEEALALAIKLKAEDQAKRARKAAAKRALKIAEAEALTLET